MPGLAPTLLYLLTAAGGLLAADRWLRPLSLRAAAILVLLPGTFAGGALVSGRVLAPVDLPFAAPPLAALAREAGLGAAPHNPRLSDVAFQINPWRLAVRRAALRGEWPLWNPHILAGDVLAAAAQPAPYHPFELLALLLPAAHAPTFLAAAVLWLAAVGGFLLARELGCGEPAALVAGAGWALCGFLAFWLGWPLAASAAPLPLVLAAVHRLVAAPGAGAAAMLGASLALSLLGGHPETTLHLILVGGLLALGELALERPVAPLRTVAWGLAGGGAAAAVTAFFWLPVLAAMPHAHEYALRLAARAADRSVPWPEVGRRLLAAVVPFAHGGRHLVPGAPRFFVPEAAGYAGSLLFAPALLALARHPWRGRLVAGGLAVAGALAAASAPFPLRVLARVPGFELAINDRFGMAAACLLALLAALGADLWLNGGARRLPEAFALVGLGLAAIVAAVRPGLLSAGLQDRELARGSLLLVAPPLAAAAVAWWARRAAGEEGARRRLQALSACLALLLVQRLGESGALYPRLPAEAFYPRPPILAAIPPSDSPRRVTATGSLLTPNLAAAWDLEDVRGYAAMTNRRLAETFPLWCVPQPVWFNRIDDLEAPFLAFLGVRHALVPARAPVPDGWSRLARGQRVQLLENPSALARAFVPPTVRLGMGDAARLAEMAEETDFSRRAWIGGDDELGPRAEVNGPGTVRVVRRGSGYRLAVEMAAPGWVVVSETAWPGWRARSAGRRLPLAVANHAFLAVRLPAGAHEVELEYLPSAFLAGLATSGLAVAALLALALRRSWRAAAARR